MKKKKKISKKWWWVFGGIIASLFAVGIVVAIVFSHAPKFEDRGVPIINIELNGVSLEEIDSGSKETKYEGNSLTIYDDGTTESYDDITIKGRGNGTWMQEKKPYQIKFNEKVDLFGMGKAKKWYLLANAADHTSLRTEVAVYLSEMLETKYVNEGYFVELYVDDEYRGLYYLTHAVEIDKRSVDLKNSLGILMELDNIYGPMEEYYETGKGDKLVVKDVVEKNKVEDAARDFLQDYNEFEIAISKRDYDKICELIDVESFAQYYLLSEFSVNPDAYWTSFYFYKDGVDDKIHAGPAWDFDLAFGNRRWGNWLGELFYSTTETMVRRKEILTLDEYEKMGLGEWFSSGEALSTTMFDLVNIHGFRDDVAEVFQERMSGRREELIMRIEKGEKEIKNSLLANDARWGINDSEEELSEMIKWIRARYDFFETEYSNERNEKQQNPL